MALNTNQIERLLGVVILPEKWTVAQYALAKNKLPCQVTRDVALKVKRNEVLRVGEMRDRYGKKFGVYQFNDPGRARA